MEISNGKFTNAILTDLEDRINKLIDARPTAVNMRKEGNKLVEKAKEWNQNLNNEELQSRSIIFFQDNNYYYCHCFS